MFTKPHIHKASQLWLIDILLSIGLEEQSNLGAATESVSARIGENFKGALIRRGRENVLNGLGVLLGRWRKRSHFHTIGHKETAVKAYTERADEVSLSTAIGTLGFRKEIGCAGFCQRSLVHRQSTASTERLKPYQVGLEFFGTHANASVGDDDPSSAILVLHGLDGNIERRAVPEALFSQRKDTELFQRIVRVGDQLSEENLPAIMSGSVSPEKLPNVLVRIQAEGESQ